MDDKIEIRNKDTVKIIQFGKPFLLRLSHSAPDDADDEMVITLSPPPSIVLQPDRVTVKKGSSITDIQCIITHPQPPPGGLDFFVDVCFGAAFDVISLKAFP